MTPLFRPDASPYWQYEPGLKIVHFEDFIKIIPTPEFAGISGGRIDNRYFVAAMAEYWPAPM